MGICLIWLGRFMKKFNMRVHFFYFFLRINFLQYLKICYVINIFFNILLFIIFNDRFFLNFPISCMAWRLVLFATDDFFQDNGRIIFCVKLMSIFSFSFFKTFIFQNLAIVMLDSGGIFKWSSLNFANRNIFYVILIID